jgi:hypothetical protein
MNAMIIARTPTSFTLQVEIPYNGSMLDFEEALQVRLNEAGVVATRMAGPARCLASALLDRAPWCDGMGFRLRWLTSSTRSPSHELNCDFVLRMTSSRVLMLFFVNIALFCENKGFASLLHSLYLGDGSQRMVRGIVSGIDD